MTPSDTLSDGSRKIPSTRLVRGNLFGYEVINEVQGNWVGRINSKTRGLFFFFFIIV